MRIIAISDIHGQLPAEPCPPCDLLIIAGDICPDLRPVHRQATWLDMWFRPWLKNQSAKRILGTWGNHDLIGQEGGFPEDLPWELIVDGSVVVEGKKFYLTPWVPNLAPRWAFSYPADVPPYRWPYQETDIDVFVVHGPPRGYCDDLPGYHHIGSESQLAWCQEAKPPVVICGHNHNGRGQETTEWGGKLYNVASLDNNYEPFELRFTDICL